MDVSLFKSLSGERATFVCGRIGVERGISRGAGRDDS